MWHSMREDVLQEMPVSPGPIRDARRYLDGVDTVYASDAYNSLSIEGYVVSPELIERVRGGDFNAGKSDEDRRQEDALAARGYYESFQLVRAGIERILSGEQGAAVVRSSHQEWHQALFAPKVRAGIMAPRDLLGYRNSAVMINGALHVPPPPEAVMDAMEELLSLLDAEEFPSVAAILAHFMIGFIHPYNDGNGRLARFVMNVLFASGGYAWTVVKVADRKSYMDTLESASTDGDIKPFASFIANQMNSHS
jgi:Fic family protein